MISPRVVDYKFKENLILYLNYKVFIKTYVILMIKV